eukprot:6319286-Amphidinium_carterae.1
MANPGNNCPNGPATNWWDNTVSPLAPSRANPQEVPVIDVPSHVSIASSHALSSAGTLPVHAPVAP